MRYAYVPESDAAHEAYDPWAVETVVMASPSVTSRQPCPADVPVPGPVSGVQALALEHGWTVELCYSRRGVEEIISVRCDRAMTGGAEALRAVALYRKATARGAWAWSGFRVMASGSWPRPMFLHAEFCAVLMEGWRGTVPALMSALDDFAEIHANGEALTKRRTGFRKALRARWLPNELVVLPLSVESGAERVGYDWPNVLKVINTAPVKISEGR